MSENNTPTGIEFSARARRTTNGNASRALTTREDEAATLARHRRSRPAMTDEGRRCSNESFPTTLSNRLAPARPINQSALQAVTLFNPVQPTAGPCIYRIENRAIQAARVDGSVSFALRK